MTIFKYVFQEFIALIFEEIYRYEAKKFNKKIKNQQQ